MIIQNKTWHVHTDNWVTLFLYERRSFNVKYFVDTYRYISITQIQKLLNQDLTIFFSVHFCLPILLSCQLGDFFQCYYFSSRTLSVSLSLSLSISISIYLPLPPSLSLSLSLCASNHLKLVFKATNASECVVSNKNVTNRI